MDLHQGKEALRNRSEVLAVVESLKGLVLLAVHSTFTLLQMGRGGGPAKDRRCHSKRLTDL